MARTLRSIIRALTLWGLIISANAAPAPSATPLEQPLSQPNWGELDAGQKNILAPLAADWDGMESFRRKKWLGIAKRYPTMTPEQQQRVREQMRPWASLSPEERNAARERFKKQHKAPPEQRAEKRQKWEEYKALPESEKRKFREKAAKKQPKKSSVQAVPRPLTQPAPKFPALASPNPAPSIPQ